MEWLFGKRMTPEEMIRKNQRALNKAMRDLDREKMKMEQQEKKVIADIKKLAKEGQMDAVKIMALDLVRTRRYVKKFMLMKANIQAVSLKIQTLKSQNTMAQAMAGVTKAMANMNRQLNLPQIQKILHEFEKQSEIMDMKEEMINETMDDAMEDEGDEEESDAIVSQVLDELGLQLGDQLSGLPQVKSNSLDSIKPNRYFSTIFCFCLEICRRLDHYRLLPVVSSLEQLLLELLAVAASEAVVLLAVVAVAAVATHHWMPMLIYKPVWTIYGVNKLTRCTRRLNDRSRLMEFFPTLCLSFNHKKILFYFYENFCYFFN